MYIQKVKLQNFRSFGDEGICFLFNKGINAVIGENNNGKTALIDAIRIAFSCVLYKILVSHNVAMRDGITMNDAIKIKTRDKKHPDFRKIPIRCYFEIKSKAEYTYSSIHGVKGETFDALMLLIHGTVGNTLTPSFLANGKTNTELMRIAYVAMTRPRKLLVVAMPKNKAKLSNRFPPDKWDYVEL